MLPSPNLEESSVEAIPSAHNLPKTEPKADQIKTGANAYLYEKEGNAAASKSLNPRERCGRDARSRPEAEMIVWWDEPEDEDPKKPINWPLKEKWANILTIAVISFLVPLVSSVLAPAVEQVMSDFNTTSTTFATFVVSVFVLGFACGPLILAPLSELYGRVVIYNITNVFFLGFTIMCASSRNKEMLLISRFLSGFSGVATITIGSGTIADIIPREQRGKAVSIWSVGTIFGPMVGPVIGGYVTEVAGWRWIFWASSIAVAAATIVAFVVLKETYPPVLLERKAVRLRKETGNPNYRSKLASNISSTELFKQSITRPSKMLILCPIVTAMGTYVAILYGTLYLLFSTYSFVFREVYGYSTFATGLVFIPGGIGTLSGVFYTAHFSDRTLKKRAAAGRPITPEDRLPLIITLPGALAFPIGLFIYGWSVERHIHWIIPQIGTAITGFGSILIFIGIQTYLIDAFEEYAASVVGAIAVLRGIAGALVPLSGLSLYNALGWGWGNSLLAVTALAFAPLPWIFGVYGAKIRGSKRFRVNL